MAKDDVLKKLRKQFGMPEEGTFDPEMFLLRLGMKIVDNTMLVDKAMQEFKKIGQDTAKAVETLAGITGLQEEIKKMSELHAALETAIKTQEVKVVEVEKVVERAPESIKVESVIKQDPAENEKSRSWFTKTIIAMFKEPVEALVQLLMNEIRKSREEDGAIAVRLVTANGENFYNAMLSVSGGGGGINTSDLAKEATQGPWSTFNATSADGSTALTSTVQEIKATAGKVGGWYIYNPNTSAVYVHLYNIVAASVTVGTSTPKTTLCIPAGAAANLEITKGLDYDTAISIAATTTGTGNTAPTTALEANIWFK